MYLVGGILFCVGLAFYLGASETVEASVVPARDFVAVEGGCTMVASTSCFETVTSKNGKTGTVSYNCVESHRYNFTHNGSHVFTSRAEYLFDYWGRCDSDYYQVRLPGDPAAPRTWSASVYESGQTGTIDYSSTDQLLSPVPFEPGEVYPCWMPKDGLLHSAYSDVPYLNEYCGNPECWKLFNPIIDFGYLLGVVNHGYTTGIVLLSIGAPILFFTALCQCRHGGLHPVAGPTLTKNSI